MQLKKQASARNVDSRYGVIQGANVQRKYTQAPVARVMKTYKI